MLSRFAPPLALLFWATCAQADLVGDCLSWQPRANPEQTVIACSLAARSTTDTGQRVEVLQNLGMAQRELDKLTESRTSLSEAAGLAPDNAEVLHQLGWTHRQLGDAAAAERALRAALAISVNAPTSLSLCVVLQDQGEFEQSVAPCEAALHMDGPNADTSFFLARAYAGVGRWSDARIAASEGIAQPDPGARLYLMAAMATWHLNDHPQALTLMQQGLDAYPMDASLLKRLAHIPMFDD
jgi:tetratricopeptide (TPR) repeat protein